MKKIKFLTMLLMISSIFSHSFSHVCRANDEKPIEEYIVRIVNILDAQQASARSLFGAGDKLWKVNVELVVLKSYLGNQEEIIPRNKGILYLYNISSDFPKNNEELDKLLLPSLWKVYSRENNDRNTVIEIGKNNNYPCFNFYDHKLNNNYFEKNEKEN